MIYHPPQPEYKNNRQLIKIVDILGKGVNIDSKQTNTFYIFDDGSIERKYILK